MPNAAKMKEIESLATLIGDNNVFYFTDYRGLTVQQLEELRNKLRQSKAYVRVAKNRLIKKAWGEITDDKLENALKNPTAMIYAKDDPVSTAKMLRDFKKDYNLPEVKAIVVENMVYDGNKLGSFADMPSPQELKGILVRTIAAPLTGFVGVLSALPRNLVYALNAIADKKKDNN